MSQTGEYKFILRLDPIDGLHMSDYDFECALYVYTNRKVVIPKSKMRKVDDDNYIAKVDSAKVGVGNYSSICETKEDKVSIWGVLNSPIIIPLILIERVENAE